LVYRFIKPSDQSLVLVLAIRRRTLATLAESRKFSTQARWQLLDSKNAPTVGNSDRYPENSQA
jgi:hypothetical protein